MKVWHCRHLMPLTIDKYIALTVSLLCKYFIEILLFIVRPVPIAGYRRSWGSSQLGTHNQSVCPRPGPSLPIPGLFFLLHTPILPPPHKNIRELTRFRKRYGCVPRDRLYNCKMLSRELMDPRTPRFSFEYGHVYIYIYISIYIYIYLFLFFLFFFMLSFFFIFFKFYYIYIYIYIYIPIYIYLYIYICLIYIYIYIL